MTKLLYCLICIELIVALTSCSILPAKETNISYNIVGASPSSTLTPTPFQPSSQKIIPVLKNNLPVVIAQLATATPFTTAVIEINPIQIPEKAIQVSPIPNSSDNITILLLGSDTKNGSSFRTDTIIIAIIIPSVGQVSLISIPRDLWVNIPIVGMQRINTAYQNGEINGYVGGGAGLLKDTILLNLGIKIDFTVLIDFDGFRSSIDTIGGVDLPISCPYTDWKLIDNNLDPQQENNWFLYTAGPGLIHMDGDLSLWYARSRKHSSDFDRGRRQQEVIRGILSSLIKNNLLQKIPDLYSNLVNSVSTDVKIEDVIKFLPLVNHLSNPNIRSYFIAGDLVSPWLTPGGANVLIPNNELIQQMLSSAVSGSVINNERVNLTVEIQNGTTFDGWDKLAAERLNYAGFSTVFQPADTSDHSTTLLYDLTLEQDHTKSAQLLNVLGLNENALVSAPSPASKTPYALIIGADYRTCFNPTDNRP